MPKKKNGVKKVAKQAAADAVDQRWRPALAVEIDLGLARSGYMNVGRFVVERVDHKAGTPEAMDHDHPL